MGRTIRRSCPLERNGNVIQVKGEARMDPKKANNQAPKVISIAAERNPAWIYTVMGMMTTLFLMLSTCL
jgi:hypothetical protein